jgi:hypothetical protein
MVAELSRYQDERINWDDVERFTPEMYELYSKAPIWELDGLAGKGAYYDYWCRFVQSLVISSKSVIGRWQNGGKEAAKALEVYSASGATPTYGFLDAMSSEPLPLAISQVHEKVALLSSNPPKPQAIGQQESQKAYVSALNSLMEMVLEANNYELLVSKGFYDIQFWNTCIFKWRVDQFDPGIFAEPGKIVLERCCPDEIFFDPECRELHFDYMDYIVQKHQCEIGDIQLQYPFAGAQISADVEEIIADSSVTSRNNGDYIQSPVPKLARDSASRRQKITVLECYFKDSRLKFEPKINVGSKKEYKDRFALDEDGFIIGDWVKRYPNGRLLVVTGNTVLKDVANPYPHGQFPYVFAQGMPSSVPFTQGNAQRIMTVTRKFNNTIADVHRYYQSEIPRPMHADSGAVLDPNLAQNVPNDPTYIIELAPGKQLMRPPAVDIPPAVFTYLNLLQNLTDMTSGSSSVMRGQLADGAQLSAEAMGQLQQFASSRLALEARFFNTAIKQLGYQLMWILRATVKSSISMSVTLPTGETEKIDWKSDRVVF